MGLFSKDAIKSAGKVLDKVHNALSSHYEGFDKTVRKHLKSDETENVKKNFHNFLNLDDNVLNKLSEKDKKALSEHAARLHAMRKAMVDHGIGTLSADDTVGNLVNYVREVALSKVEGREPRTRSLQWAHMGLADLIPGYHKMFEPGWKKKVAAGTIGGTLGGAGVTLAAKSVYDYLKSKKEEKPSEEEQQ